MTVISAHNAFSHNKCTSNVHQQSCEAGVADVTNDEMKTLKGQCPAQGHTAGVEKQTNKKNRTRSYLLRPHFKCFSVYHKLAVTNYHLVSILKQALGKVFWTHLI